ncbi:protein FATTY ACID EXPORT 4, chloroplastic [Aristolochia californica]|uniref:protein FATTY ACID EXPORT 4, chloroplastic n=1 Tax=Aristolochia californica TaxID=171875 RepID=UPI0035DBF3C0
MSTLASSLSISSVQSPFLSFPLCRTKPFTFRIEGVSATTKHGLSKFPISCNAQLAELAPAASAVYGTLLLGGGVFAFGKSGSKGSLAGGVSGAVLMATAYYLMQMPETKVTGDALGFGSAFIFSAVFGIRLVATRKFVPAGLLLGLSVFSTFVFVSAYLQDKI